MAVVKENQKKPLKVKLRNASGKVIEGIILSGKQPAEDPILAISRELSKHPHIQPTQIP